MGFTPVFSVSFMTRFLKDVPKGLTLFWGPSYSVVIRMLLCYLSLSTDRKQKPTFVGGILSLLTPQPVVFAEQ